MCHCFTTQCWDLLEGSHTAQEGVRVYVQMVITPNRSVFLFSQAFETSPRGVPTRFNCLQCRHRHPGRWPTRGIVHHTRGKNSSLKTHRCLFHKTKLDNNLAGARISSLFLLNKTSLYLQVTRTKYVVNLSTRNRICEFPSFMSSGYWTEGPTGIWDSQEERKTHSHFDGHIRRIPAEQCTHHRGLHSES